MSPPADPSLLKLFRERAPADAVKPPDNAAPRLVPQDGIRAVVFDIYGTLFSSGVGDISLAASEDRDAPLRRCLQANGIHLRATGDHRFDDVFHECIRDHQEERRRSGVRFPEIDIRLVWRDFLELERAQNRIDLPEAPDIERIAIDYESRVNPTQPMPGLAETLQALVGDGFTLGIISNAQFFTPLLFEAFLGESPAALGFCPEACIWSFRMLEAKPSTRLYERCAARFEASTGLRAENVLYIGNDMRNDIWPAALTGFRTALFAGDARSLRWCRDHPECTTLEPDLVLAGLSQLPSILSGEQRG